MSDIDSIIIKSTGVNIDGPWTEEREIDGIHYLADARHAFWAARLTKLFNQLEEEVEAAIEKWEIEEAERKIEEYLQKHGKKKVKRSKK